MSVSGNRWGDIGVPATPFLMMLNVCASDTPMSRRSADTIAGPMSPPPPPAPWHFVQCWLYRVSPSATASVLPRNGLAGPGGAPRWASSGATAHRSNPANERAAFIRGLLSAIEQAKGEHVCSRRDREELFAVDAVGDRRGGDHVARVEV